MPGHRRLHGYIFQSLTQINNLLHQPQRDHAYIDSKPTVPGLLTRDPVLPPAMPGSSPAPRTQRTEQTAREEHGEGEPEEGAHQEAQVTLVRDKPNSNARGRTQPHFPEAQ